MKIYNKKSEILRDLGKDAKDIRYLERAVERGEVVEIGGYYIIKDELVWYTINILLRDNKELKDKVESFSDISEKLEEAKANEEYYKNEAEEANDKVVALESVLDNLRNRGIDIWFANE